jgi:uncharacterized protein
MRSTTAIPISSDPWVQTYSGVAARLLALRVEDVRIEDIAAQLAKINRYSGATLGAIGYSVAQHSVLCADLVRTWGADAVLEREALLHDASEAYYGDITQPVQVALRELHYASVSTTIDALRLLLARQEASTKDTDEILCAVELLRGHHPLANLKALVDPVVREALGLAATEPLLVKRADLVALAIERRDIMAPCGRDWNLPEPADVRFIQSSPMYAEDARAAFTERLAELDAQIAKAKR